MENAMPAAPPSDTLMPSFSPLTTLFLLPRSTVGALPPTHEYRITTSTTEMCRTFNLTLTLLISWAFMDGADVEIWQHLSLYIIESTVTYVRTSITATLCGVRRFLWQIVPLNPNHCENTVNQ